MNNTVNEYLTYLESKNIIDEILLNEDFNIKNLSSIKKFVNNDIEKILKKYNVAVDTIRSGAKKVSNEVLALFDKGMKPEEASKILSDKVVKNLKSVIIKNAENFQKFSLTTKIALSLMMFCTIFYVNTLLLTLLIKILANPELALKITAIVVTPMVEEAVKNYFISADMPWVGTGVVFGIELVKYIVQFSAMGASIVRTGLVRLITLAMHFTTTYIQKKIIDSASDDINDQRKKRLIAWLVGFSVHMLWNTFAILSQKQLTEFIFKV